MNRKRIILVGIYMITALLVSAQDSGTYWYQGTVHLVNGENVEGMIQPDLEENYLLLRPDNTNVTKAYYARQVASYEIFEPISRGFRTYYSLPHPTKIKKTYLFYELLQAGELSLLRRESVRLQENITRQMHGTSLIYRPHLYSVVTNEFYVLNKRNKLTRFYGSKKEILKLMPDQAEKVEMFIDTRKLRLNNLVHLKAIFRYYHSLQISKARKYTESNIEEHTYYTQIEQVK